MGEQGKGTKEGSPSDGRKSRLEPQRKTPEAVSPLVGRFLPAHRHSWHLYPSKERGTFVGRLWTKAISPF